MTLSERDISTCPDCGHREPVRLADGGCEKCREFPRCFNCGCWVGDGTTWLPDHVNVLVEDVSQPMCVFCHEEAD